MVPTDYETHKPAVIPPENISYCYVAGLRADDPPHYILAFDEKGNHKGDGRNVLFVSRHVVWVFEEYPYQLSPEEIGFVIREGGYPQVMDMRVVRQLLKKQEEELKAQGREMKIVWPSEEKR